MEHSPSNPVGSGPLVNWVGWLDGGERRVVRSEYVAPLFAYLRREHFSAARVARAACERQGLVMDSPRLSRIKKGQQIIPRWFVVECCAVIGRSVREVMGDGWLERFGADGLGGTEPAPVGVPSMAGVRLGETATENGGQHHAA